MNKHLKKAKAAINEAEETYGSWGADAEDIREVTLSALKAEMDAIEQLDERITKLEERVGKMDED